MEIIMLKNKIIAADLREAWMCSDANYRLDDKMNKEKDHYDNLKKRLNKLHPPKDFTAAKENAIREKYRYNEETDAALKFFDKQNGPKKPKPCRKGRSIFFLVFGAILIVDTFVLTGMLFLMAKSGEAFDTIMSFLTLPLALVIAVGLVFLSLFFFTGPVAYKAKMKTYNKKWEAYIIQFAEKRQVYMDEGRNAAERAAEEGVEKERAAVENEKRRYLETRKDLEEQLTKEKKHLQETLEKMERQKEINQNRLFEILDKYKIPPAFCTERYLIRMSQMFENNQVETFEQAYRRLEY